LTSCTDVVPFLSHFGVVDEKNDKLRVLIRKKVYEYLDRAEKLKAHIAKAESKQPGVIGSNGKVSAGGGSGKHVSFQKVFGICC
jgi:vacuolar protein-sorting-associated protein 4